MPLTAAFQPSPTPLRRFGQGLLLCAAGGLAACGGGGGDDEAASPSAGDQAQALAAAPITAVQIAGGLDHPWGMTFLPNFSTDKRMLVTERAGRLRILNAGNGTSVTVSGLPATQVSGQGGLFDVVLDPGYASNKRIYWSYNEAGTGADAGKNGLAVARGELDVAGAKVSAVQVILRQTPKVAGSTGHFGGRIVFGNDGNLFVTMGDRQLTSERGYAQDLAKDHGKVARIRPDGSAPSDNPFVNTPGARPTTWSLGHRNPQGATLHPITGALWLSEHGPQGGDEINRVRSGKNYGWPLISYGCEYGAPVGNCTPVGGSSSAPGLEQPATYWVPTSTAPSGLMFYSGTKFPEWRGKLFTGALADRTLWVMDTDGAVRVSCTPQDGSPRTGCAEVAAVKDLNSRIRDVRQGPDGWIYLLTDNGNNGDRVLRLQR